MEKYSVMLKINGQSDGTYNIDKVLYEKIKEKIKPFRGTQPKAKPVRCIETGQVFKSVSQAQSWLYHQGLASDINFNLIKNACKGIQKTAYGFHWEYK